MYQIVLCFLTSFFITYAAIPSIIKIAKVKMLVDEPGGRRSHILNIPTLGGIAIFAGVIFSIILWTPFEHFGKLQYILCSFIIIFLIGAKDDILPLTPYKKMLGQIFACGLLVFLSNIRITSFYGIFFIDEIPYWLSILLSFFTLLVIINAFNFIDGINGLAAGLGILISATFGSWFYLTDQLVLAILSFALVGALSAFLKYNVTPAKIFMGDTGALLIGTICGIMTIQFIELHKNPAIPEFQMESGPSVAIGILFIPLYDMLRVFVLRTIKAQSPFHADRTHIHHKMIDAGLTHLQASCILVGANLLVIVGVIQFRVIGNFYLLLSLTTLSLILTLILWLLPKVKKPNVNDSIAAE
ncbi:MAG: undecaprenyl/decaprenyl-phosphate alpha-N-acetylglucosaminyl 1-phosphate transferase [Bacteroidota bacterium]|nr:undecaprenyl/decaprenyl-phosphate alpha-N-acetylglucosaminyl 1-phosphate transferase [Bacteroidota bacterium]